MATVSASATYRGFRKQALYALWRLLTDEDASQRVYQPEGDEDLAIFDLNNRLLQVVQVKDHSAPLTLSEFKHDSADGFFARMHRRLTTHPDCEVWIASFGQIGPELAGAFAAPGPPRTTVAKKLAAKSASIPAAAFENLVARLQGRTVRPNESVLRNDIQSALAPTMAGAHGDTALELLLFWIFGASEQQRPLTRTELLQQIERVGAYLSALRDHATEWNVSIGPLRDKQVSEPERDALRASYRLGAQATWEHILADVDSVRAERLNEVHEQFRGRQAVVIRGASGQGKSTLAFRYMRDFAADGLRFYVRFVEGRAHAIRIAHALRNHIAALGLRAVVIIDLAPSDSGWMELVKDLTNVGINVLVTVREEDFHRAGVASRDVPLGEVALDSITRQEAEDIFNSLVRLGAATPHLDFGEAWSRFTTGDAGPLLEFTHLVTEGETLTKKIEGQVARLQQEALEPGRPITVRHLKLLALAAIANEAECRVSLQALCAESHLDPLTRPLAVLEDEYLLKTVSGGSETLVAALHSVRSKAIVAALLHDSPESWIDLAIECLPLIVDADLERFLLVAFSRRQQFSHSLEAALYHLQLRSWTHAASVLRALLWEGINRYEQENHERLAAFVAQHGEASLFTSDLYVASDSDVAGLLRRTFAEILKTDEDKLPAVQLTDKRRVFDSFRQWATQISPPLSPLTRHSDWIGVGDVAFWVGSRGIQGPLADAARAVLPDSIPEDVRISEVAEFVSGRYAMGQPAFVEWLESHREALSSRFVAETDSIAVTTDDQGSVTVLFPVRITEDGSTPNSDAHDFHAQALTRVNLLRQLFPRASTIKSQGVGTDVLSFLLPNDETVKSIPAEKLTSPREAHLNGTFRNLISYRLLRAASWSEYAEVVFRFRRSACDAFRGLHRGWGRFLEHHKIQASDFAKMPGLELSRLQASRIHMFPRTSVDEWGFVSEDNNKDRRPLEAALEPRVQGNIQRFAEWRKVWRDYESAVGQVSHRAVETSILHLAKKNFDGDAPAESQAGRLTVVNLASAWKALRGLQAHFRRWFVRYVAEDRLSQLEQHEDATFRHLWPVTYAVIYTPEAGANGASSLEADLRDRRREFLRSLGRELTDTVGPDVTVSILEDAYKLEEKSCLTVVCDHTALASAERLKADIVRALWRAARVRAWAPFEATPLEVEWSHILVVHTVRGKAVANAGSFVSIVVLFGSESEMDVKAHHLIPMPVNVADFDVATWELPALSKVLAFQASSVLFILAALRFWSIAQAALTHNLSEGGLQTALASWSSEATKLRQKAARDYEDLVTVIGMLRTAPGVINDDIDGRLKELDKLCRQLLMLDTPDVTWTLESFVAWAEPLITHPDAVTALTTEIIDVSIRAAA